MLISLMVAMSSNRVIGRNGCLPWRLPADLQRFKRLTMGQSVLMGRRTYQAIGRPLPGRQIIVLSCNPEFQADGCRVAADLNSGITAARSDELFICGGGEVYRQALPLAEKIYLTELLRQVEGDTCFPELPPGEFCLSHSEELMDGGEPCRFSILQRQH